MILSDEEMVALVGGSMLDVARAIEAAVLAKLGAQEPVLQHADNELEGLRKSQAAAVMPLMGPLLDAWEEESSALRAEHPNIDKWLRKINRAMETKDKA